MSKAIARLKELSRINLIKGDVFRFRRASAIMDTKYSDWIIIDEREGAGRLDSWNEYLCARRTSDPARYEIAICCYEIVSELPREWFDDNWHPLPEYSDAEGNFALPG